LLGIAILHKICPKMMVFKASTSPVSMTPLSSSTLHRSCIIDVKNVPEKIKNVKKRGKNKKRLKTLNKKRWP